MDNARVRFPRRLAMDRESSRLYREARRAQRQLRGPAGVAAAAELGKAAARVAATTEQTGDTGKAYQSALRGRAAIASGWRPSSVSNGARSTFAEFSTPSAPAAAPAAPAAITTPAATTIAPEAGVRVPAAAPAPNAPPPLLRRLALTSGAIGGEPLLTKEGAIQRVITESSGGAATRTDVLNKINAERATLGQEPIAIDWAKDVASRGIAAADRRNAEAAKDNGNRAANGYLDSATFRDMAKPAAATPAPKPALPDSWPATDEERRSAAASSSAAKVGAPVEGLGQAVAADAAKLASSVTGTPAWQNSKEVLAKSAAMSAAAIRDTARNAATTLAKGTTAPFAAVGGATGKELRKNAKKAADSIYNKL